MEQQRLKIYGWMDVDVDDDDWFTEWLVGWMDGWIVKMFNKHFNNPFNVCKYLFKQIMNLF